MSSKTGKINCGEVTDDDCVDDVLHFFLQSNWGLHGVRGSSSGSDTDVIGCLLQLRRGQANRANHDVAVEQRNF